MKAFRYRSDMIRVWFSVLPSCYVQNAVKRPKREMMASWWQRREENRSKGHLGGKLDRTGG